MTIELFYFFACPSYRKALDNIHEALRAEGLSAAVLTTRVVSDEDAQAKRFIGSPTVRIDGVDVEGPQADRNGYGFGCRVYSAGGRLSAWPSVETIRAALRRVRAPVVAR